MLCINDARSKDGMKLFEEVFNTSFFWSCTTGYSLQFNRDKLFSGLSSFFVRLNFRLTRKLMISTCIGLLIGLSVEPHRQYALWFTIIFHPFLFRETVGWISASNSSVWFSLRSIYVSKRVYFNHLAVASSFWNQPLIHCYLGCARALSRYISVSQTIPWSDWQLPLKQVPRFLGPKPVLPQSYRSWGRSPRHRLREEIFSETVKS